MKPAPCVVDVLGVGVISPGATPVVRPAPAGIATGDWAAYRLDAATTARLFPPERLKRMGRGQAMSLGAVQAAVASCPSAPEKGRSTAVSVGTSLAEEGDEIAFLENMVKFGEKGAKPAFFVNSVKNALASQLALTFGFQGENQTFCHDALSFESSLWQGVQLLRAGRAQRAIVCGVDALVEFQEIHGHLLGWYHTDPAPLRPLQDPRVGTLPGEGAAGFVLAAPDAGGPRLARLTGLKARGPLRRNPPLEAAQETRFVEETLAGLGLPLESVGLVLLGANGDSRLDPVYAGIADALVARAPQLAVGTYRHLTGEFATASALGLALAVRAVAEKAVPAEVALRAGTRAAPATVLLFHVSPEGHHSVMVVST